MDVRLRNASASAARSSDEPDDGREFFALYDEHAKPLLAWLSARVAPSDLDDVHQDVWTKVWSKKQDHFRGGNFRAWLFALARNHLVDLSRRRLPALIPEEEDQPRPDPTQAAPCDIAIDRERRDHLFRCLSDLPEVRRRIVEARLSGESYEAISATLAITTAQAHSHFFAAKKHLQTCLEER